ncbi:MAG TPA: hypothetical protein VGM94_07610 [Galbitalea sp.]|jgi:hypothetical protein
MSEQTPWGEWFDAQYDLNNIIDRAVKERSEGKGDGFRVALYSSIIENAAERIRGYIPDVALTSDEVAEVRAKIAKAQR